MKHRILGGVASGLLVLAVLVPLVLLFGGSRAPASSNPPEATGTLRILAAGALAKTGALAKKEPPAPSSAASTLFEPKPPDPSAGPSNEAKSRRTTATSSAPTSFAKASGEVARGHEARGILQGRDGQVRIVFQSTEALVSLKSARRVTIGFELAPLREGLGPRRYLVASADVGSAEISDDRFEAWVAAGAIFDLSSDPSLGAALGTGRADGFFLVLDDALAVALSRAVGELQPTAANTVLQIDASGSVQAIRG